MSYQGPLVDRIAIRELIETYADAVARRDAEAWAATWSEDAIWDLMGHLVEGRAAIVAAWRAAMSGFEFVGFHANPGAIEVAGAQAAARVYVRETLVPAGGGLRRIEGEYRDDLLKTPAGWRFSRRAYRILHEETRI